MRKHNSLRVSPCESVSPDRETTSGPDSIKNPNPLSDFFTAIEQITMAVPTELAQLRAELSRLHDIVTNDPRWKRGYLRKEDAAKYLCVSVRTFERWTTDFKIPHARIDRVALFTTTDLDTFIQRYKTSKSLNAKR